MSTVGYATLQIIPSIKGISGDISSKIGGDLVSAGKKAGTDTGAAIAAGIESAKDKVAKASAALAKARDTEATAAEKVGVAEAKLQALRDKGVTDVGRLTAAEANISKAKRDHTAATRGVETASKSQQRAQQALTDQQSKLRSAQDSTSSSTERLGGAMGRLRGNLSSVSGVGSKVGSTLAGIGKTAGLAAAGFAGFQGVKSFLTAGWDRLSAIDDAEAKMKALGMSGQQVESIMKSVGDSVTGTAFSTSEAAGLAAQAVGAGVKQGQALTDYLTLIGDTAAVAGTGLEEIGSIFTKVQGNGKAGLEEINQITDRGINLWGGLTSATGKSREELQKMVSDGKLTADMFKAGLSKAVGGAAKNMDSTSTAASNAKAAFSRLSAVLMKPIFDATKNALKGLTVALNAIKGPAESFAKLIGSTLSQAMDRVKPIFTEVAGGIRAFVAAFRDGGDDVTSSGIAGGLERLGLIARKVWDFISSTLIPLFRDHLATSFQQVATIAQSVGSILASAFSGALTVVQPIAGVIMSLGSVVFPVLIDAAGALWSALQTVGDVIAGVTRFFADHKDVLVAIGAVILAAFLPALISAGVTMVANAATMVVLGGAMRVYAVWTKVVQIATKAWAAVQWVLNAALNANPLGLIVIAIVALVAAIVLAYRNSETFRNIVAGAWEWIKNAASVVVDWFVGTAWPWLQKIFKAIGEVALWLWQNVMQPVWNGIKILIAAWWNGVKIYFSIVIAIFKAIGAAALWLWQNAIMPAWNGIKIAISIAWAILSPIFSLIGAAFRLIGTVVGWLWRNVMVPAWNGIKVAISVAGTIIGAVINAVKAGFQFVGKIAMWLWQNVIIPAWTGIQIAIDVAGRIIGTVIEGVKSVFQSVADKAGEIKDWIVDKWNAVVAFFSGVKDKIASAARGMWDGIKDSFKAVINWVIRAWNSLEFKIPSAKVFGKEIGGQTLSVPKIPELAAGGQVARRRRDGLLSGPGTGTSDSIVGIGADGAPTAMVSTGEFVVNAAATRRWLPLLRALNGRRNTRAGTGMQALAAGGLVAGSKLDAWEGEDGLKPISVMVRRLIHQLWGQITDIGGYRASDPFPDHPSGQALDIMIGDVSLGDQVKAWLMDNKDVFGLNYTIWQQKYEPAAGGGNTMEDRGSPTQNHMDHIHALFGEIGSPPDVNPDVVPSGLKMPTGMEQPADPTTPGADATTTPDSTTSPDDTTSTTATEKPKRMKSFRELGQDVGGLVADGIVDFFGIPSWIANPEGAIKDDRGDSVRTDGGTQASPDQGTAPVAPTEQQPDQPTTPAAPTEPDAKDYSGWITKAAKDLNLPEKAAVIGNATALVESGNPMQMYANNAVPESLNYPHDAVGSDHDSVGLFQQRDNGAWGTVAQRMSPLESAKLFYNAMVKVAGWETMPEGDVAQATQSSAFPDRYATQVPAAQELVKKTGLYDRGGWLQPNGIAVNHLRKPEPVLHPDHWQAVVNQTDAVGELVGAGVGGRGDTNITVYGLTAGDIAAEIDRRQWLGSRGYGSRGH